MHVLTYWFLISMTILGTFDLNEGETRVIPHQVQVDIICIVLPARLVTFALERKPRRGTARKLSFYTPSLSSLKQHSFNIDSVNLISTPKRWTLNLCRGAFTIQEFVS